MDFLRKIAKFISRSTRSKAAKIIVMLILLSAISLTVIVVQQQQTIKQRASFFGLCWNSNYDKDCACFETCRESVCHSYYDDAYPGALIQSFCETDANGNKTGRQCMSGAHIATDEYGRNGVYTDWICDGSNNNLPSVCPQSVIAGYVIAECSATCGFTTLISADWSSTSCVRTDSITTTPPTPTPTTYVAPPTSTPTAYATPTPTVYAAPTTYIYPTAYIPPTAYIYPTAYIPPTITLTPTPSSITLVSALNAQDVDLTSEELIADPILYNLTTNTQVPGAPAKQTFKKTSIPGRQYSTNIVFNNLNRDRYFIVFRKDNMIAKSVFNVSSFGQTITVPTTTLVFGDLNNDNNINIADYEIFRGCWKQTAINSCSASDFNESGGSIDQVDYNTWLRGLSTWNKEGTDL